MESNSNSKMIKEKDENNNSSLSSSSEETSVLPRDVLQQIIDFKQYGNKESMLAIFAPEVNDSMVPELCSWVAKLDSKLKTLWINETSITPVGASLLLDTLKNMNSSLSKISLWGNQLSDQCMESLGEYIKINQHLAEVEMGYGKVADNGIEILSEYLVGNTTIKSLNLEGNTGITNASVPFLVKIIQSSHIGYVDVNQTSINHEHDLVLPLVHNILKYGYSDLRFYQIDVNDDHIVKICDYMKEYGVGKLRQVAINHKKLTSKGASLLFKTLQEMNSIISDLQVSGENIDDSCMEPLGELMHKNETIELLVIGGDNITDKGIKSLSEYLIGNTVMKKLMIVLGIQITDISAPIIVDLIKRSCIVKVDIYETQMSPNTKAIIRQAFAIPFEEREIPIKSNSKSAAKTSTSLS